MNERIKVLYVDDEPGLLELGKTFLELAGDFSVSLEVSARSALPLLGSHHFDAIISDYQMPGMDGISFLKAIRAAGNPIPFILFTGRGREEIVIEAINNGADFYLQKGGEPKAQFAELAHKIRQAVQQRRTEVSIRDHERREADIINFLPDATFAIDTQGSVIAWNRAMEAMTGVPAAEVLGKGNYAYALPFYHERRPLLIDLVLKEDPATEARYPYVTRSGDKLFSEITIPFMNNGAGAALWFTASPLYDTKGTIVGAIESIRDVTERKRAEEALRESEDRLTSVFSAAQVGIILVDASTHQILQANTKALDLFGAAHHDVIGKVCHTFICPAEKGKCPVTDLCEVVDSSERVLLGRDGRIIPVLKTVVRRQIGGRDVLIESFVDITDRKQIEEELAKSERRYREVVEQQTEFVCRFLPDGTHVFVNDAYCRYFGKKRSDIIGHRFRPEIPAEDRDVVRQHFASLTRDHPVAQTEHRIRMPDGTIRWQWWSDHAIFDESGTLVEYQATGKDITDRRHAEEALAESEANLQAIMTNTSDIIASYDRDIRLIAYNRSCSKVYRDLFGVEIAPGLCTLDLFPESQRAFWITNNERALAGESFTIEFKITDPDGSMRFFESSFNPIRENTEVVGFSTMTRDITDRRRAEDELRTAHEQLTASEEELREQYGELAQSEQRVRESEQKYRELAELLPQIVFETDKNFTITFVNRQTYAALGYPPEETASGFYALSIIDPSQHGRVKENIRKIVAGEPFEHTEYTFRRKDGSTFPGLIYANPVFRNGNLTGFRGIIIDITDRKKAQDALLEREATLASIFRAAPTGIGMVVNRVIMKVNDRLCEMTGYTAGELLGKSARILYPTDEDYEYVGREKYNQIQKYGTGTVETRWQMRDGTIHNVLLSSTPLDPADYSKGVTFTALDITERKRVEESLRRSKEQYRLINDSSRDFIYSYDRSGRFTSANRSLCDAMNLTPDRIIGRTHAELGFPEDQCRDWDELHHRVYSTGTTVISETSTPMPDGRTYFYEVVLNPMHDAPGTITGISGTTRDITDRKRAEDALRMASSKLALLSSITRHDILNSISVCRGYLALSKKRSPDPEMQKFISTLEESISTIQSQIEFTRVYQDLGAAAPVWQDPGKILGKCSAAQKIPVKSDVSNLEVFADPLFGRVFYNLHDNTVRHGGHASAIQVHAEKRGVDMVIIWGDNGVGVPPEEKEKIFERDFGKNTGLGLFLAREILEITGITITETGESGKGARFEITVPKDAWRIASEKV